MLPPSLILLLSSSFVESGAGTGWVRHLIIKNFECKYSTSVLSYKKKQIKKQIKNEIKVNKKSLNLSLSPFPIFNSNKIITDLIIWDRPENTSFYTVKFLSPLERNIINITKFKRSILIGVMLSDGYMEKNKGWNPRIKIEQSMKYFQYVWYLFNQLAILGNDYPLLIKRKLRGKYFYSLAFRTRQLICFNHIYNLLYNQNNGERNINSDLYHYFDYIVLAHWIMGDGSKRRKGLIICIDSFTIKEVVLLMNILKIKFDIDSIINYNISISPYDLLELKKRKVPCIYINEKNMEKIKPNIEPYFSNCFLYKIK